MIEKWFGAGVLILIIGMPLNLFAQAYKPVPSLIEWNEDRPLLWKDYAYVHVKRKGRMAMTSVKHSIKGYMRSGVPEFDISVVFVSNNSWTTDTTNLELLEHERLHFDIAELFRRKIQDRIIILQKQKEKSAPVYRAEIKAVLKEFNVFSEKYDSESQNGNNVEEQLRWQELIAELLNNQN